MRVTYELRERSNNIDLIAHARAKSPRVATRVDNDKTFAILVAKTS